MGGRGRRMRWVRRSRGSYSGSFGFCVMGRKGGVMSINGRMIYGSCMDFLGK